MDDQKERLRHGILEGVKKLLDAEREDWIKVIKSLEEDMSDINEDIRTVAVHNRLDTSKLYCGIKPGETRK